MKHLLPGHIDLGVLCADEVRNLSGIFQVDGVRFHADGKGADMSAQDLRGNGAHKAGIKTAGEQKAEGRVGVQPLVDAENEKFANLFADCVHVAGHIFGNGRGVGVPGKFAVRVIEAGGKA